MQQYICSSTYFVIFLSSLCFAYFFCLFPIGCSLKNDPTQKILLHCKIMKYTIIFLFCLSDKWPIKHKLTFFKKNPSYFIHSSSYSFESSKEISRSPVICLIIFFSNAFSVSASRRRRDIKIPLRLSVHVRKYLI